VGGRLIWGLAPRFFSPSSQQSRNMSFPALLCLTNSGTEQSPE
jgi:hypothetical protein